VGTERGFYRLSEVLHPLSRAEEEGSSPRLVSRVDPTIVTQRFLQLKRVPVEIFPYREMTVFKVGIAQ